MAIRVRRIYEPASDDDGYRVLVDHIWPRGVSKERARLDEWLKEVAPTSRLRRWFGHDPERWEEFKRRYSAELAGRSDTLRRLREKAGRGNVTLLFAARDEHHNNAVALKDYLEAMP